MIVSVIVAVAVVAPVIVAALVNGNAHVGVADAVDDLRVRPGLSHAASSDVVDVRPRNCGRCAPRCRWCHCSRSC